MKILSKLVIREILPPMIISLVVFLLMLLMQTIAKLAEKIIIEQYALEDVGLLLLYSIPLLLGYVIPMSLLLGVILGLNRLSADSEVISVLSGGISSHALMLPILLVACFAAMFNFWLLTEAVPWSTESFTEIMLDHSSETINSEIEPRIFNENFPGFIIFVNEIDPETGTWNKAWIFDKNDPANPKAFTADRARLLKSETTGSIDLSVSNFYNYSFSYDNLDEPTQVIQGGSTTFHIVEGKNLEARVTGPKSEDAMRVDELMEEIGKRENVYVFSARMRNRTGRDQVLNVGIVGPDGQKIAKDVVITPDRNNDQNYEVFLKLPKKYKRGSLNLELIYNNRLAYSHAFSRKDFPERRNFINLTNDLSIDTGFNALTTKIEKKKTALYWINLHKKFALPFTCFIFAFLALPLGLSSRRGGKAYGYIIGIITFVAFWGLLSVGETLAKAETVSPAFGVWLPNMVFGALAILLFVRKRMEIRVPVLNFLLRVRSNEDFISETLYNEEDGKKKPNQKISRPDDRNREGKNVKLGKLLNFPPVIDRYIIKTFLKMFILVFLVMYAVFSLVQYIDRSNEIQKNDVDPTIIIDFFKYQAPETVQWIIPISTLMATMITFGILSKYLEVTAFKSSGISIYRMSVPVIFMAVVMSVLSFANQDFVVPKTSDDLARVKAIIEDGPVQSFDPNNRWILAENKQGYYYFRKYDDSTVTLNELDVYQYELNQNFLKKRIYCQRATWDGQAWISDNGWEITYRGVGSTSRAIPDGTPLPIPEDPVYFGQELRPADQMSYSELEGYVDNLKEYGLSTTSEEFELYWKLSFPFLPLIMTLLGLPFAFTRVRKSGALTGVAISLAMVIIYWGMMTLFKAMGETGYLPALMAAWAPNISFAGLGILMFSTLKS